MNEEIDFENSNSKLSAKKVSDNRKVYASEVTKEDGPFYCIETFEELIVRKCVEKVDHFAYKARMSPIASRESKLHKDCKAELLEILTKTFPNGNWESERQTLNEDIEKGFSKVVPDLSGRINGKGVIIEIQKSSLSLKKIRHRTEQYTKRRAYILWIVPLTEDLGNENFRPRLFERFLHTMYYGKVYYWYKGNGTKLIPVHYGTAERWIEENTWYNEQGEEQTSGGYNKPYLRLKKPEYRIAMDLTIDFKFEDRKEFELENYQLSAPECKIYVDKNPIWCNEV